MQKECPGMVQGIFEWMVKREISGSGRIRASIFVDGRSMTKDRSKSKSWSKLVLDSKWIACDLRGDVGVNSLQTVYCSLELLYVDGLGWFWLFVKRDLGCSPLPVWMVKTESDSSYPFCS